MMKYTEEILNKPVEIVVIKKMRNKHTYLRVKEFNLIEISTNIFFTLKDAKKLINIKKLWIEERLKILEKKSLDKGIYKYLGQSYQLNISTKELDEFYRTKAKEIIPELVDKHSKIMNLYPTSIKFRKNKNTWGSCNYKNGLNFNIYLMKFPLDLIEYVVIHELAHIKHKNHSKRFWNLVEKYCIDYKQRMGLFKTLL